MKLTCLCSVVLVLCLLFYSIDSANAAAVTPSKVTASSTLPASKAGSYEPHNAIDGNLATAWVEGDAGDGRGQWIEFSFDAPVQFDSITICNGYQKSPDSFANNARLKAAILHIDHNAKIEIVFADKAECTNFDLTGNTASRVRLEAREVYPGKKWQDMAVSEVRFQGSGLTGSATAVPSEAKTESAPQPAQKTTATASAKHKDNLPATFAEKLAQFHSPEKAWAGNSSAAEALNAYAATIIPKYFPKWEYITEGYYVELPQEAIKCDEVFGVMEKSIQEVNNNTIEMEFLHCLTYATNPERIALIAQYNKNPYFKIPEHLADRFEKAIAKVTAEYQILLNSEEYFRTNYLPPKNALEADQAAKVMRYFSLNYSRFTGYADAEQRAEQAGKLAEESDAQSITATPSSGGFELGRGWNFAQTPADVISILKAKNIKFFPMPKEEDRQAFFDRELFSYKRFSPEGSYADKILLDDGTGLWFYENQLFKVEKITPKDEVAYKDLMKALEEKFGEMTAKEQKFAEDQRMNIYYLKDVGPKRVVFCKGPDSEYVIQYISLETLQKMRDQKNEQKTQQREVDMQKARDSL